MELKKYAYDKQFESIIWKINTRNKIELLW
jgi:hypothetical protein